MNKQSFSRSFFFLCSPLLVTDPRTSQLCVCHCHRPSHSIYGNFPRAPLLTAGTLLLPPPWFFPLFSTTLEFAIRFWFNFLVIFPFVIFFHSSGFFWSFFSCPPSLSSGMPLLLLLLFPTICNLCFDFARFPFTFSSRNPLALQIFWPPHTKM